jgi:hypothetical protein
MITKCEQVSYIYTLVINLKDQMDLPQLLLTHCVFVEIKYEVMRK